MSNTLAIHWAATTHGTWLHGDPRGSWQNGRLIGADPYLEAEYCALMASAAVKLDFMEQRLVAEAFGEVVREQRHRVFAATVQATHVHLVLAPVLENVTNVIARLKRRASMGALARRRRISESNNSNPARMAGLYSRPILGRKEGALPRSVWTAGQFPIFIFDERHLTNAIEYVRDHNRRTGLAPDPFSWIDPLFVASERAGERSTRSSVVEQQPS